MNALDSLRRMVDHYPGGRAAVAVRLGKTDEVLRKELAGSTSHKLGVLDAHAISEMCAEAKSPHASAYANTLACIAGSIVALPVRDMTVKQDLRADMAGLIKECSDTFQILTSSLADERISDNELKAIEKEIAELAEKLQSVHRGAREQHRASRMRAVA